MFRFSLEPVLVLKEKMEDNKKRELGVATMKQEQIYQEKITLEQKKRETLEQARNESNHLVDIASLKALNQYGHYMNQAIRQKGEQLEVAKQKVTEKRQELLEVVKERKILENLKAIHRENFDEEVKREEQRIMDDIVTYRFGIKGRE